MPFYKKWNKKKSTIFFFFFFFFFFIAWSFHLIFGEQMAICYQIFKSGSSKRQTNKQTKNKTKNKNKNKTKHYMSSIYKGDLRLVCTFPCNATVSLTGSVLMTNNFRESTSFYVVVAFVFVVVVVVVLMVLNGGNCGGGFWVFCLCILFLWNMIMMEKIIILFLQWGNYGVSVKGDINSRQVWSWYGF